MVIRAALVVALAGCLSTPSRPLAGDARGSADAPIDGAAFSTRHWVHQTTYTPGPAVIGASLAYDSDRHEVLRYGGQTISGDPNEQSMSRLTPTGWQTVCDPCMPGRREGASFAYDPVRHVAVLAGGRTAGLTLADAFFYEWDGATWTKTATQLPAPRCNAQMVFDPARGKLVLIGGEDSVDSKHDAFTYDGTLAALPDLAPYEANNGGSMATYDTVNMRVLVAPGSGLNSGTGGDEVLGLGTSASSWSVVCSSCGAWRRVAGIMFDPVLHRLILVGGYDMTNNLVAGTFALGSSMYTKVDTNPPGRENPALVYDGSRDTIVLYGGFESVAACGGNGLCNDTWEMAPN